MVPEEGGNLQFALLFIWSLLYIYLKILFSFVNLRAVHNLEPFTIFSLYTGIEQKWFSWQVSGYALAGYVAGIVAYVAALQFHDPIQGMVSHLPTLPGI